MHDKEDESVRRCVKASLEKRWAKTDQEAFILAVFFNPYIRDRLFSGDLSALTRAGILGMLRRMFERVFPKEERQAADFSKAFSEYCDAKGDFSAEHMDLDAIEAQAEEEVSLVLIRLDNCACSPAFVAG